MQDLKIVRRQSNGGLLFHNFIAQLLALFLMSLFSFLKARIHSFKWAFLGSKDLFLNHPNAQVHALATFLVVPLGFYLQLPRLEWAMIIWCIAFVLSMEALNSAVEYLADKVSPEHDPLIGKAKDIAAAAVLLASIGAALVGFILLGPRLYEVLF
ncbi:MAG: diacylglycerol kinase family protein [Aureispira sp.]